MHVTRRAGMKMKSTSSSRQPRRRRQPRRETLELLAANLRLRRALRKYSQEGLANEIGVHRTYVGDLERCQLNPTLSTLEVLADGLGIQIAELFSPIEPAGTAKN